MRTRPYWLWYGAGGIGYERIYKQSNGVKELFSNRANLLRSSFTGGVFRSFGRRFGASLNLDYGRRHDRFNTDGDGTNSNNPILSSGYFTDLNAIATISYLVPTRGCDFAFYAGTGFSVLQGWSGERVFREESTQALVYNTASPYDANSANRLRYTIGTRAAVPINEYINLMFDSQVLSGARYGVNADGVMGSERGTSFNVRLGVGYRLESFRR